MKNNPVSVHSSRPTPILALLLLSFWLPLLATWTARAAEPAGTVAAATGQVTAAGADGEIRELLRESPVLSGDVINTGPNSRVRIIFSDNSIIVLRPSTRFVIDDFRHTGDPKQDQSAFSLVRGGFRAVTGAIGHANQDSYRIETPTATIGIRGTDHEGRYCAGDCLDLSDLGVAPPLDGLYTGTSEGRTVVGGQEFGPGEYGFTDPSGVTVRLPEPPPILTADPHLQGDVSGEEEESTEEEGAAPADEAEAPEEEPAGDGQAEEAAGDSGSDEPADDEFEIPAKPLATNSVQC